jgi:hypothetical protein
MTRAPARSPSRSSWLVAAALAAALVAGCSSSGASSATTPSSSADVPASVASVAPTAVTAAAPTTPEPNSAPAAATALSLAVPTVTLVPIDPSVLIPVAVGNKPFPGDADKIATEHQGFSGDANAPLQAWSIIPMAVPSGPDVRLLGFERQVGISSTTALFLTGAIDPDAALAAIQAALAPSPTYAVTPTMRTDGSATIHGFDAQPTDVRGDPPGWTVEASSADQLGLIRIKRSDYTFAKAIPAFADLPQQLQAVVVNPDAIAVSVGGTLASIAYEFGKTSLADPPVHRTRLGYDIANDFTTATADLQGRLTVGWEKSEHDNGVYFTSTAGTEVWTLDNFGGDTHLTYDTGS